MNTDIIKIISILDKANQKRFIKHKYQELINKAISAVVLFFTVVLSFLLFLIFILDYKNENILYAYTFTTIIFSFIFGALAVSSIFLDLKYYRKDSHFEHREAFKAYRVVKKLSATFDISSLHFIENFLEHKMNKEKTYRAMFVGIVSAFISLLTINTTFIEVINLSPNVLLTIFGITLIFAAMILLFNFSRMDRYQYSLYLLKSALSEKSRIK